MIVTDASVVLAFLLTEQSVAYAREALAQVRNEGGVVPGNFISEVCEGLLRAERRGLPCRMFATSPTSNRP